MDGSGRASSRATGRRGLTCCICRAAPLEDKEGAAAPAPEADLLVEVRRGQLHVTLRPEGEVQTPEAQAGRLKVHLEAESEGCQEGISMRVECTSSIVEP